MPPVRKAAVPRVEPISITDNITADTTVMTVATVVPVITEMDMSNRRLV
jgi:hypothetical protein